MIMFPDIAAIYQKNRVTGLPGLQKPNNGENSGSARNPKHVTPKDDDKAGLQKTAISVTPIQEDKTGLQKQGYAGTRMDTGFAGSVTQVTHVTPFFNEWGEALEAKVDKTQQIRVATVAVTKPQILKSLANVETLAQFRIDDCLDDPELELIDRINDMAYCFMETDGMSFDDAITLAAEIVVHGTVAHCEASYTSVRELWLRLTETPKKEMR